MVFEVVWKKDKTVVNIAARILFFFLSMSTLLSVTRRAQGRAHCTSCIMQGQTGGSIPCHEGEEKGGYYG